MNSKVSKNNSKIPKNFQAILDWCEVHRPDIRPMIESNRNVDAFVLLLTVGFESGRQFQHDNPNLPLNQTQLYLY